MPVRRKAEKRRYSEGLDQWYYVFVSGYDYFGELPPLGIPTDSYGRPSTKDCQAAWLQLGSAFLDIYRAPNDQEAWALATFGEPGNRSKRRH